MSQSKLIVLSYENEGKAVEVLKAVASLKQENVQKPLLAIEDAAIAVKNEKGKVKISQTLESVVKGSNVAGGGFWGLLIGLLFGGPIFGALLGMGLSAFFGRKIDIGIDNDFIKSVGDELGPGNSVLFLLIHDDTSVEIIADTLKAYGGTLYHTSLAKESTELLEKAMEDEKLQQAVQEHHA